MANKKISDFDRATILDSNDLFLIDNSGTTNTVTFGTLSSQILASNPSAVPIGAVCYFAMETPPIGWLVANGQEVSRTAYPVLFSTIGVTYGRGDGSTTFKLPDLRGEFIRGLDSSRGVDINRKIGSWQNYGTAAAGGNINMVIGGDGGNGRDRYFAVPQLIAPPYQNELLANTASKDVVGTLNFGGTDTETRPRNVALLPCIKATGEGYVQNQISSNSTIVFTQSAGVTSVNLTLPYGIWIVTAYFINHEAAFPTQTLRIDGSVVCSYGNGGDPAGTSFRPMMGMLQVNGGRIINCDVTGVSYEMSPNHRNFIVRGDKIG